MLNKGSVTLETPRLILRKFTLNDVAALVFMVYLHKIILNTRQKNHTNSVIFLFKPVILF